jgi:hypothetical protein
MDLPDPVRVPVEGKRGADVPVRLRIGGVTSNAVGMAECDCANSD